MKTNDALDTLVVGTAEIAKELFGSSGPTERRRVRNWIVRGFIKTRHVGALHTTTRRHLRELMEPDEAA